MTDSGYYRTEAYRARQKAYRVRTKPKKRFLDWHPELRKEERTTRMTTARCTRCGREARSGIIDGLCVNVGGCTRRAVKRGLVDKPVYPQAEVLPWLSSPGTGGGAARYIGESNIVALRRELRTLRGQMEHAGRFWRLVMDDPGGGEEFDKFVAKVIDPALKHLNKGY
jgi:hypothetical protein